MKRLPIATAALLAVCACGGKTDSTPAGPTTITLSQNSFSVAQAGETVSLTVTAPARPKISGVPSWITVTEGAYKDYKMSIDLTAASNETYDNRTADLSVFCAGADAVALTVTQPGMEPPVQPTTEFSLDTDDPLVLSARLGLGWNMGNHFDAYYGDWAGDREGFPDEEVWGNPKATKTTFVKLKEAGFTSVRIPVSWLRMIGSAPGYTINQTWMDRVHEVTLWAKEAGLYVIVNTHHDENHGVENTYQWLDIKNAANDASLNAQIKEEIKAVWTQIAEKFKDCGDWLIFEGFNELNDGGWGWSADFKANPYKQAGILDEWNQVFVNTVRATGGNNATRWLGVPTYCANPEYEKYLTMPSDPAGRLMLSVHFYDPSDYTIGDGQQSDWGHTGKAGQKASGGDEDHVRSVFGNLYTKYVSKGVPVYLGEFGCSLRDKSNSRAWAFYLYYMEYVVKAAKTYGMPCFHWDNGAAGSGKEHHAYINHGTGDYIGNSKDVIDVMKKARFTESADYTLDAVYNSAPSL